MKHKKIFFVLVVVIATICLQAKETKKINPQPIEINSEDLRFLNGKRIDKAESDRHCVTFKFTDGTELKITGGKLAFIIKK
jgi:hypothetical protein